MVILEPVVDQDIRLKPSTNNKHRYPDPKMEVQVVTEMALPVLLRQLSLE